MEAINDEDDDFISALAGSKGAEHQLMAFRAAWRHGHSYIKTIRQAALGCHSLCKEPKVQFELESLCRAVTEIDNWYTRYADDLYTLERMAGLETHSSTGTVN